MKKLKKEVHEYTAIFEPDEEQGGYTVYVPALPGCISEGDTFEAAAANIREAAALWLEVMKSRQAAPASGDTGVIVAPVRVIA